MSSGHVKFGDEDRIAVATKPIGSQDDNTSIKNNKKKIDDLSDSDSDSDDDAPEEEGMSTAKDVMEERIKQTEEAKKLEQQALKEKRRKQDTLFREQQADKKRRHVQEEQDDEPLEELPAELLQKLEDDEIEKAQSTHINFHDDYMDDDEVLEVQKQIIKKKKKNVLKSLRKKTVKHGSINVTLLTPSELRNAMAPKREVSIVNTKDKWLKRKSLHRK